MLSKDALLGIRVLDMSRVLAGPFTGMLLADMGADVIKLEMPGRGDDSRQFPPFIGEESMYYVNLNRGKKSITINLKTEEGKNIFKELVKQSDVLLENFRPGTMNRLGIGYEALKEINPRLVYAAISGFGQYGPYSSRPGYDIIGQAMGGLLSITGWPDSPPTRSGTAIGDILSSLFCTVGILGALKVRDQTGVGQLVDIAVKKGRSTKPDIKLGICGEHGGDPSSIEFCHRVGLTYVSCSPFRVPIARLAAAQAVLKK